MSKWNSAILNRFTPLTFNKLHFQGHERTYACHRINAARKLKGILCWERIKDFQALPPAPFPKFLMGGGDMADLEGQGELAVTVVFIHTLCPASGSPSLKMQWLLKKKKNTITSLIYSQDITVYLGLAQFWALCHHWLE